MLESIKQRLGRDDEQGFTLIELMVVVLIIAILLAIAIPTFLGAKNTANARGAQSNLRNALTAEQTYWTNNQAFVGSGATADSTMQGIEPQLNWNSTAAPSSSSTVNTVAEYVDSTGNILVLEAYAKDGNCYIIEQTNAPGLTGPATGYNEEKGACTAPTTVAFAAPSGGHVSPQTAAAYPAAGWVTTW